MNDVMKIEPRDGKSRMYDESGVLLSVDGVPVAVEQTVSDVSDQSEKPNTKKSKGGN